MLPAFLITIREVIEASLIVATILGILVKFNQKKGIKTVWYATAAATVVSVFLIGLGSIFGFEIQHFYSGRVSTITEGALMMISAIFITWAVFFLHKYFSNYKVHLLQKIKESVEKEEQKGLFVLAFTAVLREGFEIVLFLSTVYLSSNPTSIFIGFMGGAVVALLTSLALFASILKLPVYRAFRATSLLLILFAAGLLARGAHEFVELGILPELGRVTFSFLPQTSTFMGNLLQVVFGITQKMNMLQLGLYSIYSSFMIWWVFLKKKVYREA